MYIEGKYIDTLMIIQGTNQKNIDSIEPSTVLQQIYSDEDTDMIKTKEDYEAQKKLERNRELGRLRTRRYRERMALKRKGIQVEGCRTQESPEDSQRKLQQSRERAVMRSRNYRARVKKIRTLEENNAKLRNSIANEENMHKMMRSQQILYMANRDMQRQRSIIDYNKLFQLGVAPDNTDLQRRQALFTKLFFSSNVKNLNVGYSGLSKHLEYGRLYRDLYPRIEQQLVSMHASGDDQEIITCQIQFKLTIGKNTLKTLYPHLFKGSETKNAQSAVVKPEFDHIVQSLVGQTVTASAKHILLFSGSQVAAVECVIDYSAALYAKLQDVRKVAMVIQKSTPQIEAGENATLRPTMVLSQAK